MLQRPTRDVRKKELEDFAGQVSTRPPGAGKKPEPEVLLHACVRLSAAQETRPHLSPVDDPWRLRRAREPPPLAPGIFRPKGIKATSLIRPPPRQRRLRVPPVLRPQTSPARGGLTSTRADRCQSTHTTRPAAARPTQPRPRRAPLSRASQARARSLARIRRLFAGNLSLGATVPV